MNPSSQSLAPLSRLLWKEYRVQRSLWLAMLVLGVVPQLLFKMAISDQIGRVQAVWSMVFVLPFLFVIGSAAILFAGEREERTVDWLRNLAAPPLWTLLAKWSFLLIATAALVAALSIVALALVWTAPIADLPQDREEYAIRAFWMFAGVFLWSVLGSLISRRVITSVPAMGFWWLMTLVVPVTWFSPVFAGGFESRLDAQNRVLILSFITVAIGNVVLGWRWCQGKYLDAGILDYFNSKFTTTVNRLRGQTQVKSRLPKRDEADSHWRREWQRLVWQERYREVYHRSLLYLGCVVGVLLGLLSVVHSVPLMLGIVPMIVAMPLAMGVLGFRYDGEGHPLRFLSQRGVEPRMLWLAKHAVWLPRAIWIPLVVWLVAGFTELLMPRRYFAPPGRELLNAVWLLQTYPGGVLAFILLTYGCGHLAATLLRRVVLAAVVGIAASLVATLWLVLAIAMYVPLWWSVGGVLLWIYGLSYWNSPFWLMERPLVDRPVRLMAFVIPPLLLVVAWGSWRASEIPGLTTNLLSGHRSQELQATAEGLKSELANYTPSLTDADQKLFDRLLLSLGGGPTTNAPDQSADAAQAFWQSNESRLNELMEITRSGRGPSLTRALQLPLDNPSRTKGQQQLEAGRIGGLLPQQQLLLEAGRLRTKEGRLNDALGYFCASLRLASYWATDTGLSARHEAQRQQLHTVQSILDWANHPNQTGQSLRSAQERLKTEFDLFPPMHQTLLAEHLRELTFLEESIRYGTRSVDTPNTAARMLLFDYFRLLPWEEVRARRFLEQQLLDRVELALRLTGKLRVPGMDAPRFFELARRKSEILQVVHQSREVYWKLTTPLAQHRDPDMLLSLIIEREVVIRESMLALSLLAWRQDHQQWPDSLADLLVKAEDGKALPAITTIDPWSGELFEYNGTVLNQPAGNTSTAVLLATAGPSDLREIFVDDPRDGYGATPQGVGFDMATWQGTRAPYDDRLLLKVTDGKLAFQLMNSERFPRKKGDNPMGASQ